MSNTQEYDSHNIMAKIIRGELPAAIRYQDEEMMVIDDINPHAPTHVLIIPKSDYISFHHFTSEAHEEKVAKFFKKIAKIAELLGVDKNGYRLITNIGKEGGQTVPHFHVHLLAGKRFTDL